MTSIQGKGAFNIVIQPKILKQEHSPTLHTLSPKQDSYANSEIYDQQMNMILPQIFTSKDLLQYFESAIGKKKKVELIENVVFFQDKIPSYLKLISNMIIHSIK